MTQNTSEKTRGTREWHDNGVKPGTEGYDYGCWWSHGACLPDLTVSTSHITQISQFGDDIIYNNGNAQDNIDTFNKYKDLLLSYMSSSDFDKVIDGTYIVSIRGKLSASEKMYIVLGNATGPIVVYPLGE